ncbi:MAG: hypothetical protein QG670_1805 [Thermoproteota archaeon]|nr:hypothetical protein [Thermoproteota archaeon]
MKICFELITHKERFFTAIRHEEPDMVPVSAGLDTKFLEILTGRKAASVVGVHHGGGSEGRNVRSSA